MQFNQIKETCLYVKDLKQTSVFYKDKLGLEQFSYVACKQEFMDLDIHIEQEKEWEGGFKSFYFRDPDCHLAEVIEKGMWEA